MISEEASLRLPQLGDGSGAQLTGQTAVIPVLIALQLPIVFSNKTVFTVLGSAAPLPEAQQLQHILRATYPVI